MFCANITVDKKCFVSAMLKKEEKKKVSSGVNMHVAFNSSPCSTTGVTKAVVCATLSVGWCIKKEPLH